MLKKLKKYRRQQSQNRKPDFVLDAVAVPYSQKD